MIEAFSHGFMQNALAAGLLASAACGLIGTLVVANRMTFLAGGVAHAAYGGVGLAVFFALPMSPTIIGFSVAAALLMALVTRGRGERTDTVIGAMWASGMALGVILLDLSPGYNVDLMSFLFGSILAVPGGDLAAMALLDLGLLAVTAALFHVFSAMAFDREFAAVRGLPVTLAHFLLPAMIAVTVVMVIRVVGLILVIALLTMPPHMAQRRARSLGGMMTLSALYSAAFCVAGLLISYSWDMTSGAVIIAVAAACYFLSLLGEAVSRRLGRAARGGAA